MNYNHDTEFSSLLATIYERLIDDPNDTLKGIEMHHSTIYYIKNHINDLARDPDCEWYGRYVSTKEIYQMLLEEDLLSEEHKLYKDRTRTKE